MKAKAIEIRWHDTQPIFSADFHSLAPDAHKKVVHPYAKPQPTSSVVKPQEQTTTASAPSASAADGTSQGDDSVMWRLATAGGDKTIRMWLVTPRPHFVKPLTAVAPSKLSSVSALKDGGAKVEYLATLNKHNAVVNVVRWSPDGRYLASAGDDGQIILWREREVGGGLEFGESAEDREYEREAWTVLRMMSNPLGGEVYDLSWSPDSSKLICGSMDHTFTVWDVSTGRPMVHNKDHKHYVQGVAWDPLDQYIATQSSDENMHVYQMTHSGPSDFELRGVGKSTKVDIRHTPGGTWDQPPPPPPPQRSRSFNSATGSSSNLPPPSPNGKGRMIDRPGSHHRSLSRDSTHSDMSRASLAETLAGASASIAGGSAIADADEESTPMDPPTVPVRPSSRRSSTAGSSSMQSPGLTAASLHGLNSSRPMRSPSPAPLPAIMPPSSPKLAPPPASPSLTAATAGRPSPFEGGKVTTQKLYADKNTPLFFRRLDWSPDGSLLLTPAGLFEDPYAGVQARAELAAKQQAVVDSPMTVKKGPRASSSKKDDIEAAAAASGPKPTVYVYSRANLARPPVAHLPGHKTTSIAVRFCPILWKLRKWRGGAEEDDDADDESALIAMEEDLDPIKLDTEGVDIPLPGSGEEKEGAQAESREGEKSLFDLPYRMVYAVATLDAIFLYDTQQAGPIAMFSNLHYAPFTDLSWSVDGQTLVVSSQDGYCSIIAFEPSELGTPYEGPRRDPPPIPVPAQAPAAPIPIEKVPVPAPLAAPTAQVIASLASVPQKREQAPTAGDGPPKEKKKAKRANLTQVTQPSLVQTTLTTAPGAAQPPSSAAGP